MRKRITIIIVILVFLSIAVEVVFYVWLCPYYSYAPKQPAYHSSPRTDDTLKVLLIGDSWVAYHPDSLLVKKLGIKAKVMQKGYVGEKSKSIYMRLFEDENRRLVSSSPDYCVISAGINDVIAKMGPEYYAYHYELIIRLLLVNHVTPVVIEIPDVGFGEVYRAESLTAQIRHVISSWVTGTEMFNVESYRNTLLKRLTEADLLPRVLYISRDMWNPVGYLDPRGLYLEDAIHLNPQGYQILDSCLATQMLAEYSFTGK